MPLERRSARRGKGFEPNLFTAVQRRDGSAVRNGEIFQRADVTIHFERAEHLYPRWPSPTCIISDGPYGVSGFPGDERKWASLAQWYEPHITAWSQRATPETTLWF